MKTIGLLVILSLFGNYGFGQTENRELVFDSIDLKIIERADLLLVDPYVWNKEDDRECEDDIANKKYSLFCSLFKASIDVTGQYDHRRAGMQVVRFTLEKYEQGRVINHRLMDWNNHPETTLIEVKNELSESILEVKKQIRKK